MTRAMFATILGRLHVMKVGQLAKFIDPVKFNDVDYDSWHGEYIDRASGTGIINGVGNSKFNPDAPVTKQEMAVMLYRFLKVTDYNGEIPFADSGEVDDWAREAVVFCAENGLISGDSSNKFHPADNAKRHEVASFIARYMPTTTAQL